MSFADPNRPAGDQSLGICVVHAADIAEATRAAWATGINPGGQISFTKIDETVAARLSFPLPEWKLLTPTEARALSDRIDAELAS